MEAAVIKLGDHGLSVSTSIRDGDAVIEIAAYAREVKADLAVVGHDHKGFFARLFEGSVGASLLDHLPCSLLIATDGSHLSSKA